MQRYFLKDDTGSFDKDDAHHMISVMRFKTGDQVIVCYQNICHFAELSIEGREVKYEKKTQLPNKKMLDITVIQGLPKGSKVDFVCKTATIFGASQIVFTPMKRSIAKLSNEDAKLDRFYKIAKEAAELAHRQNVPIITFEQSLKSIKWAQYDLVILADEEAKDTKIAEIEHIQTALKIAVIVGPEGGIDQVERKYLMDQKAQLVTLGAFIMPTEFAHIAMLNTIYQIKS